jgi:hypothetical protein
MTPKRGVRGKSRRRSGDKTVRVRVKRRAGGVLSSEGDKRDKEGEEEGGGEGVQSRRSS